jgi:hypothetical protein
VRVVDWIDLAQKNNHRQNFMKAVMNFRIPYQAEQSFA